MPTQLPRGSRMTKASRPSAPVALLFGRGFSGTAIAERLKSEGWHVVATTRDGREDTLVLDGTASPELRSVAMRADLVVSTVGPRPDGSDPVLDAIDDFPAARAVVYMSATSVYGDRGGQWAFEGEAPRPSSRRGFARAEAELAWFETGHPVHVLRCAGIYGPGRSAFDKLERAVVKEGHVVNRIHVDDIAALVVRIARQPSPGIYNVADGHPAPPDEVVDYAARLLGRPRPQRVPWTDPSLSAMARSFYAETKRVSIAKAQRVFGWQPTHPTYKTGLESILARGG